MNKTLYAIPVSETLPEKSGNYYTDRGEVYFDGKYWKKVPVEYWYTDQPPTAQQATSKSLPDILNEIGKREGCENWHHLYSNLSGGDHDEYIKEAGIIFASQFQQPHPQDSSSGEVEEIKGVYQEIKDILDRNYNGTRYLKTDYPEWLLRSMDEIAYSKPVKKHWFLTYEAKQRLKTPPASESLVEKALEGKQGAVAVMGESLEQAALDMLMACRQQMGNNSFYWPAESFVKLFISYTQHHQQQKPLVVLPTQQFIFDTATEKGFPKGSEGRIKFMLGMKVMLDEIRTRLSAANGVDPVKLVEWACGLGLYQAVSGNWNKIDDPFKVVYETTQELLKDYLTEQTQQQNKGK